ncbi:MAG: glycoside hydrolase family 10 protein, partial [Oscillospiraceae bacterium]
MNRKIKSALGIFAAVTVMAGCAGGEAAQSAVNVVDAGAKAISNAASDEPIEEFSDNSAPETATFEQSPAQITTEPIEDTPTEISTEIPAQTSTATTQTTAISTPESITQTTASTTSQTTSDKPAESTAQTTVQTTAQTTSQTEAEISEEEPNQEFSYSPNSYAALNHSVVKGVWISYIELAEMLTGKSASEFRAAIGKAYDNCVSLGLNTVFVHVRSHGDAYYDSDLFAWSKYASGTFGKAPGFDPLDIMIDEAHSRGLSFQAWINPLRCCGTGEISGAEGTAVYSWANGTATAGKYIVNVGGTYYLNPAYGEVIDYIAEGAAEIAANYDVDGVHIDDYFYPTTDSSFDSAAFNASSSGSLSDFRFANCDRLVRALYSSVKAANPTALFGVSCQGSMENNYNLMYADVKKWCTESGYVDYIAPQIYYGFDNSAQPYKTCTSEWNDLAKQGGIPLIVGLSASKIGLEDTWAGAGKTEWITDENILARQLEYAEGMSS